MIALRLPEGLQMMDALVSATAELIVPTDVHAVWKDAEGEAPPAKVSLREHARVEHMLTLLRMVRSGEVVPRSKLTQAPRRHLEINMRDFARNAVTFADAQAFCRALDIDLQPQVEQSQEQRDAALLAQFRVLGGQVVSGELGGKRGALAALVKADGRTRQTLTPILLRAAQREADPLARMSSGKR